MLISQKDVKNDSWSPVLKAICWLIKKKKNPSLVVRNGIRKVACSVSL